MPIWLKEGKSESEIIEADDRVKKIVEDILNAAYALIPNRENETEKGPGKGILSAQG